MVPFIAPLSPPVAPLSGIMPFLMLSATPWLALPTLRVLSTILSLNFWGDIYMMMWVPNALTSVNELPNPARTISQPYTGIAKALSPAPPLQPPFFANNPFINAFTAMYPSKTIHLAYTTQWPMMPPICFHLMTLPFSLTLIPPTHRVFPGGYTMCTHK